MAKTNKRKVLGRGLSVLLNDENKTVDLGNVSEIDLNNISINPNQPRTNFKKESINELKKSIKELGLIQPITVRELKNNKFQLISGERRLRAFKLIGLNTIPSYVRKANDIESLEMALVENIQREDLDPIEIALSYNKLLKEINLTQEELSLRIGKERSTISNYIRLLKLDPIIQSGLRDNFLSMGHARALINIKEKNKQIEIYKKIVKNGISVRDTEKLLLESKKTLKKENNNYKSKYINQVESKLKKMFDSNISVRSNNSGKGYIKIEFKSQENLENIINKIKSD
ncbi:MAG: ParB/RepB/Spo0J family partition protein [Flavobacteriaceae bacterium]|tara:strand:+ start:2766 stop:3626 length:861 start_codon:yes stop_codon:yes gene_type:complete